MGGDSTEVRTQDTFLPVLLLGVVACTSNWHASGPLLNAQLAQLSAVSAMIGTSKHGIPSGLHAQLPTASELTGTSIHDPSGPCNPSTRICVLACFSRFASVFCDA